MKKNLSNKMLAILDKYFFGNDKEIAIIFLTEECGTNLPLIDEWNSMLDRIRYAVIKISDGDIEKFEKAINVAKADWRDVLVWADFAENVNAHNEWVDTNYKG